jgi:hypothetical protein
MKTLSRSNLTSWTPLIEEVALQYAGNHTQDYEDAVQDGMVRLIELADDKSREYKPEHVTSQVREAIGSDYRKEATLPQSHTSESDIALYNDDGSRKDGANEVLEYLTESVEVSTDFISPVIPSNAPQFTLSCGHVKALLSWEPFAMCLDGCGEMKVGRQIKTAVGQPFSAHEVEEVHFQTNRDREFANPDTLMGSFIEDYEELPEPSTKSADVSTAQREKSYLLLDAYVQHTVRASSTGEYSQRYSPSRFGFERFLKKLEEIGARLSVAYNTPPEHLEWWMDDVPMAMLHNNPYHRVVVKILVADGYVRNVIFTRFYSKKDKRMVPLIKLEPSDKLYKEGAYYLKDFLDEAFPLAPSDPGATHEQCIGTRRTRRMDEWYAAIEGKNGRYYDRADFQVAKVKALLTGCGPWLANVLAYSQIFPYKGPLMMPVAIRGSSLVLENGSAISLAKAWRCWTALRFGSSERKEKFCTLMEKHFPSDKNAKNLIRILRTN